VREELAKYISQRPCPECGGARLNRPRRATCAWPTRDAARIAACEVPLDGAGAFFARLEAARQKRGEIATKIVKEIASALQFPGRRRPRLPHPGPLGRDAVGRRGAAHPPGLADRRRPGRRDVRARRALDRPAPARQRPPARHAHAPARPGQHGDRGRARRGRDPRWPTTSSTSARVPGCMAAKSCRRARQPDILTAPRSLTGQYLSGKTRIDVPAERSVPRRIRTAVLRCAARAATT
jgi:excinuclease ABC subunit A